MIKQILILVILILSIESSFSQPTKIEKIKVTSFTLSEIPDSLSGCSCLFSKNEENYNSDSFIYFDDYGDNCVISIDDNLLILKSKSDKFCNKDYCVFIQNKEQIGKGYESSIYNAELVIIDKAGNKEIIKIYGICGC